MENINSLFSNYPPPLPGCNTCPPISCGSKIPKEPLNFGIAIYSPISSVPGSAALFFIQPLLTGKVFASIGVLIAAQIILFIADRFWGLESRPMQKNLMSPQQTVQMSLNDLHDFLTSMSQETQPPSALSSSSSSQDISSTLTTETPEVPLIFGLSVWGDYSNQPFGPSVFFLVPILTFPGARGALPLLILELLTTIFVRSVVPPQTTGSKPLTDPASNQKSKLLQFTPEDLLNLLNRFSKHFGT